ncbi:hypothetical protein JAAARDRAFT_717595 [Jaapia argillacea MUCL 33604]|uniref:AAA+ ATPase domain-containing protein n=2 Tax=Jaapia argillacea MUCL 33604 TaxID=933084 RepID=A0A067PDK0_9AGAM|nr:hypothetical protein JAAARDRAFT_717595 [Jaapia argillacea MUCL 33604]
MSRHSFSSQPHPNPIQRRTHSHSSPNLLNPTPSSDSPTFLSPNSNSSRLGWLHRSETLDLRSHTHTHSRSQSNALDRHHSTASRLDRQASSSWRRGDHPSRLERERSDISFHWLFRSNIPRRRGQPFSNDAQRRNFFGMGEIIGVITNPAETVRSLTESRRLLNEARQEIEEGRERAQLRPAHTFSRLPGFWERPNEVKQIERALEGEPSFTVLFGASSVGKTALLREVLSRPTFHVLHFDLRIAGFADLGSLYTSLSQQMEMYFECVGRMRGYEVFEREGWGFKHDRLNVERRVSEAPADSNNANVKVSDIARLMELFQSSLLKYWEHQPPPVEPASEDEGEDQKPPPPKVEEQGVTRQPSKTKWTGRVFGGMRRGSKDSGRPAEEGKNKGRVSEDVRRGEMGVGKEKTKEKRREKEKELPREPEPKKMPVIFFDEAHKLPALIRSTEAMKCLLDSMLVLTKQDRLCHVIHATSDPFYQTWLRQLNIMQHCKIITIGDCSKAETRAFFNDRILPRVPESMRRKLNFERLYDAFGGKLAHWHDYITDYVNRNGKLDVTQSSHFLQTHALSPPPEKVSRSTLL